ncbi:MAG: M20/M25/M40 family metallo-hydrolase [Planctomycetota bacterium]|nr:MAG: M20/M25/M40 family metallo-hydrolase [Planctomycetota bacterium]
MNPTAAAPSAAVNGKSLLQYVDGVWERDIVPAITDYIRIPNKSPLFDPQWREHGHMERAVALIEDWCRRRAIRGLKVGTVRLPDRTPLIFIEIPASGDHAAPGADTVLLYGHLDKQPEMTGWRAGLDPWTPVREGDKLYGRGGADDGYAAFASLCAIEALQKQGVAHARCVVLIEATEESGSYDLPAYVEHLAARIGSPSLVVCLDSGCGDYERLWSTTSLRGIVAGNLRVQILGEGVHSGDASGIVPSSFRILRSLLSRLENEKTGAVIKDFHVEVPEQRRLQARKAAKVLKDSVHSKFPFVEGARPISDKVVELILNRTWKPALAITGAAGLPALQDAGNVLRPYTAVKISLRVPPTCEPRAATARLKAILETDPPYGAHVSFEAEKGSVGWNAPALAPWLEQATDRASRAFYKKPAVYLGEGGSIPFMGMLGEKYPQAQFLITGVLGPGSNAHGPNEFLHLAYAKKLTCCVAQVVADHAGVRPPHSGGPDPTRT